MNSYSYDANGNLTSRNGNSISYTSYNLPGVINAGTNSSTLSYGAWRKRSKQVAISGGSTETTISVAGLLEKRAGSGFLDTGISGFRAGHRRDRRNEVHEEAQT